MKIVFYYYMGAGGGLSNLIVLLRTMARRHPEDAIEIVTSRSARFAGLQDVPNIGIRRVAVTGVQEIDRLLLGVRLLRQLVRAANADVLWSVNLGPYVKPGIPSLLAVNNPYQVYEWNMSKYHPGSRVRVAALRWFFRRSLRLSDAVMVQTPMMGELVRRIEGAPAWICVAPKAVERESDVKPEPLPPALRHRLASGDGADAFTFLYVSTWTPHKNHITLLETFSELARRNVRARLVLTVTAEEIQNAKWPASASLVDRGYIVPAGWIDKAHLRSLYEACNACLMPSNLESLSSAHLEAMQWGRPQIVADLPYARDLCGPAAIYVPADDPQAWVRQILRMISDVRLRDALVAAGLARMQQYPSSWDEAAEAVHQLLVSVATGTSAHRRRRGRAPVTRATPDPCGRNTRDFGGKESRGSAN